MAFTKDISVMDVATLALIGAGGLGAFYDLKGDQREQAVELKNAQSEFRRELERVSSKSDNDRKEILDAIEKVNTESEDGRRRIEDKLDRLIERELER